MNALWPALAQVVATGRLRVRIDCAMVPLLSPALASIGPDRVRSLGVFGCEAARNLGALDVTGAPAPCSFLRGAPPTALRDYHAHLPAPCDTCELAPVCRGGCQAVSLHSLGHFSSDPECPRVLAHTRAREAPRSPPLPSSPASPSPHLPPSSPHLPPSPRRLVILP